MFLVVIAIVVLVLVAGAVARRSAARSNRRTIQSRIAAVKLGLSLIAQLAQRNLLLILQVATNVGIFTVRLAALC